ncbi:sensor histidine kinase [Ectobacillus ponti]|uniref:histidine kinase n=1 Tax=Ectobacillus ponti TaxID=2961894 RepID=A0AA41X612_9BACI|nr:sensor histidine kinase [Ectobacillus ponti]MCP8969337.1 sensor histidine kinase [Ectobacillus ponti]
MKLFLREHLPLTVVYTLQLLFTVLIFWLADRRNLPLALYTALLSTALYIGYLLYRYITHRSLYQRLSQPLLSLEEFMGHTQQPPLAEAVQRLFEEQFRQYQHIIHTYEDKQRQHLTFVHQWVHQMKTPVSVLHLMLQEQEDVDELRAEVDRIERGLQMILYTSRLDTFAQDLQAEPVHIEALVKQAVSEYKRLLIRNRVYPQFTIDSSLHVASDQKWLAFVLGQLITNAVRYSAGCSNHLQISAFRDGRRAVLEVQDFGIGIPQKDIRRVFDSYFTGENGRRYGESTGMGLYLVKQICEKLGHRVQLTSQEGSGTRVQIMFHEALTSEGTALHNSSQPT